MRTTRVMTWIFLGLSAAFFCVRDFRSALQMAAMDANLSRAKSDDYNDWERRIRRWALTQEELRALEQRAEKARDAQALAFVALHLDDAKEAYKAADDAAAIDPGVSWIGEYLLTKHGEASAAGKSPELWFYRLAGYERGNAMPLVVRADLLSRRKVNFPQVRVYSATNIDASALAGETEWLDTMKEAFAQPHARWLGPKLFLLERKVMQKEGWDTPAKFLATAMPEGVPNLLGLRTYANYKVFYLAAQAEKAHRTDEALRQCRETADFGLKMIHDTTDMLPGLIGVAINLIGGQELANRLDRAGRKEEAASVRNGLQESRDILNMYYDYSASRSATNDGWTRVLFPVLAALVTVFGGLSVLAVLYVNLKRWIRPNSKGYVYQLATVAENYFPILLFAACLGLFLVNLPYANNFRHYMTVEDPARYHDIMYNSTFPLPTPFSGPGIPLHSELQIYAYAAGAALALIFVSAAVAKSR